MIHSSTHVSSYRIITLRNHYELAQDGYAAMGTLREIAVLTHEIVLQRNPDASSSVMEVNMIGKFIGQDNRGPKRVDGILEELRLSPAECRELVAIRKFIKSFKWMRSTHSPKYWVSCGAFAYENFNTGKSMLIIDGTSCV
jgi:hypothetical protein